MGVVWLGWNRQFAGGAHAVHALLLGGVACLGALPVADAAVAILGSPVVDFTLVAVCIAAIVAFTILFEIGLEKLEHKLEVRLRLSLRAWTALTKASRCARVDSCTRSTRRCSSTSSKK